jgi:dihydroxy-acid dehydratase
MTGVCQSRPRRQPGASAARPGSSPGCPIALVADDDPIVLDVPGPRLQLLVDDAELSRRHSGWKRPGPNYTTGVLAKFAALVSGADRSAVCTMPAS